MKNWIWLDLLFIHLLRTVFNCLSSISHFLSTSLENNTETSASSFIVSAGFHEDTDTTNLRVADAVATILYKRKPEALQRFLNLEYEIFNFSCNAVNERGLSSLVISRSGREVTVSKS